MRFIYFDNAATTKPYNLCMKIIEDVSAQYFGNPSSLHNVGLDAENVIKNATKTICSLINVSADEIIYTSGGTESNNCAIFSAAYMPRARGKRLITSKAEHPSVLACFEELEKNGFEVAYLNLSKDGGVDIGELYGAVNENTLLTSISYVNSETGVIQPIKEMVKAVKSKNEYTLFHCDAVQAFGKININGLLDKGGVDYMSFSAHKIHALKGAGALYIKKGAPFKPLIYGGGQQGNRRSGTENTLGIAAFAAAAAEKFKNMEKSYKTVERLKGYIVNYCNKNGIYINGKNTSPYILNISVTGIKSEVLLHALESEGIYVSSGSACSKRQKTSKTLESYKLPKELAESAIRLSFCESNTIAEAEEFIGVLSGILPKLRRYGGLRR